MNLDSLLETGRAVGLPHPLRYVARTGSTNDDVRALAREGAPHGTALIADAQDGARGRLGRVWVTPPGAALALSVLVRPTGLQPQQLPLLALAAAVAVAEVCPGCGIKWPNDVLDADGRKVAGILAELEGVAPPVAVIGIGINVGAPGIPGAGWLEADGAPRDRAVLAAAVVRGVLDAVRMLGRDSASLLDRWRARSYTLGRRVRVNDREGVAVALDPDGALVLVGDDGVRARILAGDVHLVEPFDKMTGR